MNAPGIEPFPHLQTAESFGGPASAFLVPQMLHGAGRPFFKVQPKLDRDRLPTAPPLDLWVTGHRPDALAHALPDPAVLLVAHATDPAGVVPPGRWVNIDKAGDTPPDGLPFGRSRVAVVAGLLAGPGDALAVLTLAARCRNHYLRTIVVAGGDTALLHEALEQRRVRGLPAPCNAIILAPGRWPERSLDQSVEDLAAATTFFHRLAEARRGHGAMRWLDVGRLIGRLGVCEHRVGPFDRAPLALLVNGPEGALADEAMAAAELSRAGLAAPLLTGQVLTGVERRWWLEGLVPVQGFADLPASQTPSSTSVPPT